MKHNFRLIKTDAPMVSKPRCLICGHDEHSEVCKRIVRSRKGSEFHLENCGCSNNRPDGVLKMAA